MRILQPRCTFRLKLVDALFHVAGDTRPWSPNHRRQTRMNVEGTRNLFEAVLERRAWSARLRPLSMASMPGTLPKLRSRRSRTCGSTTGAATPKESGNQDNTLSLGVRCQGPRSVFAPWPRGRCPFLGRAADRAANFAACPSRVVINNSLATLLNRALVSMPELRFFT
jgi:hypothetical protein